MPGRPVGGLSAVELRLELRGRNVAERPKQALRVEPGDPLERRVLDVVEASPRPLRWITSALYSRMTLSARALSSASLAVPTDGAAASRSV